MTGLSRLYASPAAPPEGATMTFHKQLFRHKPKDGVWGDCFRTAIACLLGLEPSAVPHFNDRTDGRDDDGVNAHIDAWLKANGLALVGTNYEDGPLDSILKAAGHGSSGLPYILSGTSKTGVNHCVIAQGSEIVWDPSLGDAGIIGPLDNGYYRVEWLVRPATSPPATAGEGTRVAQAAANVLAVLDAGEGPISNDDLRLLANAALLPAPAAAMTPRTRTLAYAALAFAIVSTDGEG